MLSKFLLTVIILAHIFILTKLIYFPYPELFVYPYLTNHGLKPYSQILDQHFPGLIFLPLNLDNLGMNTPGMARIWSITIVLMIHLMLYVFSYRIFKNKWKALIVNFLYLIWHPFFEGWVFWIDSFLPLLLLPASYALYKRKLFLSGLFLGLGIVFKQTLIPLSFLIFIYLFWQSEKSVYKYLLGLLIPIILMLLYLISIGVIKNFWYWTVIFNLTTYAQYGRGIHPSLAHFSRVFLVFGSAFLVFKKMKSREGQILLIFLIGTLLGLSTRFDFVHFQPALPFAILATVYGLERFGKLGRLGIFGYTLIAVWWLIIFYNGHLGQKVFFFDEQTKITASKIKQYTKPMDKIFVFGAPPHLYQMADRLPAGNIFVFQFPWFLMKAEGRILEGIKRDQPEVIVSDRMVEIEGESIKDYAGKIDRYIQENYEKIDSVGSTEILRKKNG